MKMSTGMGMNKTGKKGALIAPALAGNLIQRLDGEFRGVTTFNGSGSFAVPIEQEITDEYKCFFKTSFINSHGNNSTMVSFLTPTTQDISHWVNSIGEIKVSGNGFPSLIMGKYIIDGINHSELWIKTGSVKVVINGNSHEEGSNWTETTIDSVLVGDSSWTAITAYEGKLFDISIFHKDGSEEVFNFGQSLVGSLGTEATIIGSMPNMGDVALQADKATKDIVVPVAEADRAILTLDNNDLADPTDRIVPSVMIDFNNDFELNFKTVFDGSVSTFQGVMATTDGNNRAIYIERASGLSTLGSVILYRAGLGASSFGSLPIPGLFSEGVHNYIRIKRTGFLYEAFNNGVLIYTFDDINENNLQIPTSWQWGSQINTRSFGGKMWDISVKSEGVEVYNLLCDDGEGTVLKDSSGNGNDATLITVSPSTEWGSGIQTISRNNYALRDEVPDVVPVVGSDRAVGNFDGAVFMQVNKPFTITNNWQQVYHDIIIPATPEDLFETIYSGEGLDTLRMYIDSASDSLVIRGSGLNPIQNGDITEGNKYEIKLEVKTGFWRIHINGVLHSGTANWTYTSWPWYRTGIRSNSTNPYSGIAYGHSDHDETWVYPNLTGSKGTVAVLSGSSLIFNSKGIINKINANPNPSSADGTVLTARGFTGYQTQAAMALLQTTNLVYVTDNDGGKYLLYNYSTGTILTASDDASMIKRVRR